MRRLFTLALAVITASALSGCGAKKEENISKDLEKRGTVDLMKEVEKDHYDPPADGRLTEAQIQMYLKVREHEKDIAKVAKKELDQHAEAAKKEGDKSLAGMMEGMKGLGSVADILTADIRAAKDLGYNTQEYTWVKGQVLAASGYEMTKKMQEATTSMADSSYQQIKKQYDEAKDEQTKKALGEMLASMEKSKAEIAATQQQEDPAVAYNHQLLSKYDNALNAIATEMSKFENKEGEAKQGVEEWQKNLDKAVADSKKEAAK